MQGVFDGSHYNRAWLIHSIVAESLERLLLSRFFYEKNPQLPDCFIELAANPTVSALSAETFDQMDSFSNHYESYENKIGNGDLGKTPHFWLMYIDLIKQQHLAHTAVQENSMEILIHA